MILMDKGLCVSPTLLIKYRLRKCNLLALKVFYFLLSKSKVTADKQQISLWEVTVFCNYNQSKRGDLYTSIRDIIRSINYEYIALSPFTSPDKVRCFQHIDIIPIDESPHIEFILDKDFLDYCSTDTPTFDIEQIRPMKSKYSILYYKWIEAHNSLNEPLVFEHNVEDLKLILDLYDSRTGEYAYGSLSDFKRNALRKLQEEINSLTNYYLDIEFIKSLARFIRKKHIIITAHKDRNRA